MDYDAATSHLSKLRFGNLSNLFEKQFFFHESPNGIPMPSLLEFDLNQLKSLCVMRRDPDDAGSKWLQLDGIDLLPFRDRLGVPHVQVGFVFETIGGEAHTFKSYRDWITRRVFGPERLFRKNENLREGESSSFVTLSQVLQGIRRALSQQEPFDLGAAKGLKSKSEKQPKVAQFLLSPHPDWWKTSQDYTKAFNTDWEQLTKRQDFEMAFSLISALSDRNRNEPKEEPLSFVMEEAVFTKHAVHRRAITVWSHAADGFNRDTKPRIVTRPFSFLWLLARLCSERDINPRDLKTIFDDSVATRRIFFSKCLEYLESCE